MKKIIIFLLTIVCTLSVGCTCRHYATKDMSKNDYHKTKSMPNIFNDNNGDNCYEGGISPNWIINGYYRVINGELHAFYVVPPHESYAYYAIWERERSYPPIVSETGWVRLSDVLDSNSTVSRVVYTDVFVRYQ